MAEMTSEVVVLGGGPGGYSAAFRAADLGKQVILIEQESTLGGVCLNRGCIPSKALLHAAKIIEDTKAMSKFGLEFSSPTVDLEKLRAWKNSVITKLTSGLAGLAKRRKVTVLSGTGKFISPTKIEVQTAEGSVQVAFDYAIIAAGSEPVKLPFMPDDSRIMDSTAALSLQAIPETMLIIGGGIIGLEMATVYSALGCKISIVEFMDQLAPGADPDLVKPLHKAMTGHCQNIWLNTKVVAVEAGSHKLAVKFEGKDAPDTPQEFDRILVAVGRKPSSKIIGLTEAGVEADQRGYVKVDCYLRTKVPNIFAIGDIIGNPMLAHKASTEGRFVAEVIAGINQGELVSRPIPSVAYTDPEIAWVGVTEKMAQEQKLNYGKGTFPWLASGRSLTQGREEGMTKLLFDKETEVLIGAGMVGPNAGELISELALALEMKCTAKNLSDTVHPHPTLAETIKLASESFEGTITDLYMPKRN